MSNSGSPLLGRLANYFPSRFLAYAFLDIGYYVAPITLTLPDIEAANKQTLASLGYSVFGYWLFYNEPEAPGIFNSHVRLRNQ